MARLGARRGELGPERSRHVSEPREPDPYLWIERQGALAGRRNGPASLEHGHEAPQLVACAHAIRHPVEPAVFPRGDHFALHHERASGIGAEREEWLHFPRVLAAQGRRGLEPETHERASRETVPQVVLQGAGHAVERPRLPVQRRARAGLELEPLAQAMLVDVLLTARLIGDDDFVFRISLFDEKRSREVQLTLRPTQLAAQGARVAYHGADLRGGPRLAKRRHVERQPECGSPLGDDVDPAIFSFGRRALAFVQVRGRHLEPGGRGGRAPAVRAMARFAPRREQRGPGVRGTLHRDRQHERQAGEHHASLARRCSSAAARSASRTMWSTGAVRSSCPSTTGRPSTNTSRTSLERAEYTMSDTGSPSSGWRCGPDRSSTTRSARFPGAMEPISCSSPRARAPPSVASSSTWAAGSASAPRRGFWIRAARRISAKASRPLLQGAPSAPMATRQPAASISGIFATPLASFRFEEGQCTTVVR